MNLWKKTFLTLGAALFLIVAFYLIAFLFHKFQALQPKNDSNPFLFAIIFFYVSGILSIAFLLTSILSYTGIIRIPKIHWQRENTANVDSKKDKTDQDKYGNAIEELSLNATIVFQVENSKPTLASLNIMALDIAKQLKDELCFPMVETELRFHKEDQIEISGTIIIGSFSELTEKNLCTLLRVVSTRVLNSAIQKIAMDSSPVIEDVVISKVYGQRDQEEYILQPSMRVVGLICFPFIVILLLFAFFGLVNTSGSSRDIENLQTQIDGLKTSVYQASSDAQSAQSAAADASAKASAAESAANRAAQYAQDTNSKLDAHFKNSLKR